MIVPSSEEVLGEIDQNGWARIGGLLSVAECAALVASYDGDGFRSTVIMERHGFGRGQYRYFSYPLPDLIQRMRAELYAMLSDVANIWETRLQGSRVWPQDHESLRGQCALAGQPRPTPLLLRYGPGDYNRLHQDLYGALAFPLQVVTMLSDPDRDFSGGELVLVENVARMQSRPIVIRLLQGDAAIIPVRYRPVARVNGWGKTTMRHGVSTVSTGTRHTLGLIFHDAP